MVTQKIAYLIVNKDANLKAVSKEIFKLSALIGSARVEEFKKAYQKCSPHTEHLVLEQDFHHWERGPSNTVKNQKGESRDECQLTLATEYVELNESDYNRVVKELIEINQNFKDGPETGCKIKLKTYKNVILTPPIQNNGALDNLFQKAIKKVKQ